MQEDPKRSRKRPEWAAGLRQLYDSVVEEPLPDSFSDLLSQFDETDATDPSAEKAGGKSDKQAAQGGRMKGDKA